MLKQERADYVLKELERLYPVTPVPLDHKDPYTLLIAVLLSAQCTDIRVNQITPALFAMADNPKDMITHSIEEILEIVKPCGLGPRKAKAIWVLSDMIMNLHGGEVPEDMVELEKLPGVGHKTASVVVAQAFGVPAFPVDTHIHRICQLWGLTNGKNVKQTELDCKKLFPKEKWNKLHLQIIFYGREYCKARQCYALKCPICKTLYPGRKTPKQYNNT